MEEGYYMKKFEVIEDNGGGLTLVVFDAEGKVDYIHSGYEYVQGQLKNDLEALRNGDNPVEDWDGNCGGSEWEYGTNPQALYDDITSCEYGWKIVADNEGVYHEKMGCAAHEEFNILMEGN